MVSDSSCTLFPGIVLCAAYKMQRSVTFLLTFIHLVLPLFSSSLDLMTDFNCPMGMFNSLFGLLASAGPRRSPSRIGHIYVAEIMWELFLGRRILFFL